MDRVFKSHTGAEDAKLLLDAQRDVGLLDFLRTEVDMQKTHNV